MVPETQELIAASERRKRELIEMAGRLYTLPEVAPHLNISEQLVDERREAGTIIAVKSGEGYGYPACQFGPDEIVPSLAEALADMPLRDDWMRLEWRLVPDDALDGLSPLEALRAGHIEDEIVVARGQSAK
ncbi:hypothetical protein [Microvirga calopogonii]|uniref:hypothetical protein n=1 Tax=Microvirga calopogonii TaxID=2078013 RepID=UPI0013B3B189|nr:hypothetical protein [Microvirga calopogonii]